MQVINDTTFGGNLGTAFGTGLGNVLSGLAEAKTQQLHQRQTAAALQKFPGLNLSAQDADELSYLAITHPQLFNMAVKQKLQTSGNDTFRRGLASNATGYIPQQNVQQAQNVTGPVPARQEENALQQLMGSHQQQPKMGLQNLQQLIGSQFRPQIPGMENFGQQNQMPQQEISQPNTAGAQAQQNAMGGQKQAGFQPSREMTADEAEYNRVLQNIEGLTPQQAQEYVKSYIKGKQANIAQENKEFEQQQKFEPFLRKETEQYTAQRKAGHVAKRMLENIEKNKAKWPGVVGGLKPTVLQRDKDVRKYMEDVSALVPLLARTRKGVPANYKIKLEELSKAFTTMPVQTQISILKDIIEDTEQEGGRQKYLESFKDQKGNYPQHLERKLLEYDQAVDDPLNYPQFYRENTQYVDNGVTYIIKNGQWREQK